MMLHTAKAGRPCCAILSAIVLAGSLLGCSGPELPADPVVARLDDPRRCETVDFGGPFMAGSNLVLEAGFSRPERNPKGHSFAWMIKTEAQMSFRTLKHDSTAFLLELRGPSSGRVQELQLQLNGHNLGTFEISSKWRQLSVAMPAGSLHFGRNELQLEVQWLHEPPNDGRQLALAVGTLQLEGVEAGDEARFTETGLASGAWGGFICRVSSIDGTRLLIDSDEAPADLWLRLEGEDPIPLGNSESTPSVDLSPWAGREFDLMITAGLSGFVVEAPRLVEPVHRDLESSVLLVIVDTLRADAVGAYGGEAQTPVMDNLAKEGLLIERAYSNAPMTGPSHASLFTSLIQADHGVEVNAQALHQSQITLAERMRARFRRTAGFVSLGVLKSSLAFDQGFDHFDDRFKRGRWYRDAGEMTDVALDWLETLEADEPFFAFVHYSDPHEPYAPFDDDYESLSIELIGSEQSAELLVDGRADRIGFDLPAGSSTLRFDGPADDWFAASLFSIHGDAVTLQTSEGIRLKTRTDGSQYAVATVPFELRIELESAQAIELEMPFVRSYDGPEMRRRYLDEVESVDRQMGRLLNWLEESGRSESTLVIFTSDHGEGLEQHALRGHVNQLYDSVMRVPLMLRQPGRIPAGRRQPGPVSLIDILPTLFELLGEPIPSPIRGRSFLQADPERELLMATFAPQAPRDKIAIVRGQMKAIQTTGGSGPELYDLEADPGELNNLAQAQPDLTAELLARLHEQLSVQLGAGELAADQELDEEQLELLRSLGYLQ